MRLLTVWLWSPLVVVLVLGPTGGVEVSSDGAVPEHARGTLAAAAEAGAHRVPAEERRPTSVTITPTRRGYTFAVAAQGDTPLSTTCDPCGLVEAAEVLEDLVAASSLPRQETPQDASLTVETSPEGAFVFVDGSTWSARAVLLPGRHRVRVEADGHAPVVRSVDIEPGESKVLFVALDPVPAPAHRPRVWASLGTGIGALALLGSGIGLLVIDGRPDPRSCEASGMDINGRCARMYATRTPGAVLTGLGAAGVTVAITLGIRALRKNANRSRGRSDTPLAVLRF